jgi:hypothetical protein
MNEAEQTALETTMKQTIEKVRKILEDDLPGTACILSLAQELEDSEEGSKAMVMTSMVGARGDIEHCLKGIKHAIEQKESNRKMPSRETLTDMLLEALLHMNQKREAQETAKDMTQ